MDDDAGRQPPPSSCSNGRSPKVSRKIYFEQVPTSPWYYALVLKWLALSILAIVSHKFYMASKIWWISRPDSDNDDDSQLFKRFSTTG